MSPGTLQLRIRSKKILSFQSFFLPTKLPFSFFSFNFPSSSYSLPSINLIFLFIGLILFFCCCSFLCFLFFSTCTFSNISTKLYFVLFAIEFSLHFITIVLFCVLVCVYVCALHHTQPFPKLQFPCTGIGNHRIKNIKKNRRKEKQLCFLWCESINLISKSFPLFYLKNSNAENNSTIDEKT